MFPLFFVVSFLWVCSTFQVNPCLWYILVLKVRAYGNSFPYVGYTQSRDVNSKSVTWALLVCCTRNCTRNMNDLPNHIVCLPLSVLMWNLYPALCTVLLWCYGDYFGIKKTILNLQCAFVSPILRWRQDWSQVSTWLTSLPHTFPIFYCLATFRGSKMCK